MNLDRYFARIGYAGSPRPDLETLRELHRLHPVSIPFENLSTLLGEPVRLDPAALEDKLVRRRRGGYCFEQNTLFMHVLAAIGFSMTPLAARVIWNQDVSRPNPRTHMALLLRLGQHRFLCDVGFGAATLTAPLRFETGIEQETPHETYRIVESDALFELQMWSRDAWRGVYRFDLQPQDPVDYEAMNHFVETHPGSVFLTTLMACRPDATGRYTLRNNELARYVDARAVERRTIPTGQALEAVLQGEFAIELPDHPDRRALLERVAASRPI